LISNYLETDAYLFSLSGVIVFLMNGKMNIKKL